MSVPIGMQDLGSLGMEPVPPALECEVLTIRPPWRSPEESFLSIILLYIYACVSQVALVVKNCLPLQETKETYIRSLTQEDPLQEGMATHPSIFAWRIPLTEEAGRL